MLVLLVKAELSYKKNLKEYDELQKRAFLLLRSIYTDFTHRFLFGTKPVFVDKQAYMSTEVDKKNSPQDQ